MKYVVLAVIALIIVVGIVVTVRMIINADKADIDSRKAKRDQRLIRDLHRQAIADAVDDPASRQLAYKITDHYIDD